MQVIKLPVADGISLSSWYKPPVDKKPVIYIVMVMQEILVIACI